MRTNHALLKRMWDAAGLPFVKRHVDRLKAARIKRNRKIPSKAANHLSFRLFWRSMDNHPAMRGRSRRYRRALAKAWYREMRPGR